MSTYVVHPGVLNDIVTQNAKYTFFVCLVQLMSDHWGEPHINMLNASGVCLYVCMYVCMYVCVYAFVRRTVNFVFVE